MVELLDGDLEFQGVTVDRSATDDWIHRLCRWCPSCLRDGGMAYGRIGWEIRFADACPGCGSWLVDRCNGCNEHVSWSRDSYGHCRCGASLQGHSAPDAPPALVAMSRALELRALDRPTVEMPLFDELGLHQCQQLIRWVGSYGARMPQRARQKLAASDTVEASWPVTTLAAEVFAGWPESFRHLLDNLRSASSPKDGGSLARTFGGFYRALYAAFGGSEYAWVRRVFEDYVAEHWSGSMGRRNRRVYERAAEKMEWIPAAEAARQIGVSSAALHKMASRGVLDIRSYETAKGRKFSKVSRTSLAQLLPEGPPPTLSLSDAAAALGLTRARLLAMLPIICAEASKLEPTNVWRIPVAWASSLQATIDRLPLASPSAEGDWLSLDWLFRYEAPSSRAMGTLINAIVCGAVRAARTSPADRLSQVRCLRQEILALWQQEDHAEIKEVTVVEAACRLHVKQEVAYALVRSGLLASTRRHTGRREVLWVPLAALARFQEEFVFGRDLATIIKSSPRAVAAGLVELGVQPVAGPGIDACRQLVFRRADMELRGIPCSESLSTGRHS